MNRKVELIKSTKYGHRRAQRVLWVIAFAGRLARILGGVCPPMGAKMASSEKTKQDQMEKLAEVLAWILSQPVKK